MKVVASNHFIKFMKKSPDELQLEIDNQVTQIINNPKIGELKKGDLAGIRIQKFKYGAELFLLSYGCFSDELQLFTIGSHENFYKKLKHYLR